MQIPRLAFLAFLAFLLAGRPPIAYAAGAPMPATLAVTASSEPLSLDPTAPLGAWEAIAPLTLGWDVQHQRPASESAVARIATDATGFSVRFDVKQREGLLAQQHANNVGDGTDDEVWVDFWPGGNSGFFYQFAATSNGTHFQYSGENTAYAPTWESHGAVVDGGFVVTMHIPYRVMRIPSNTWKMQLVRIVRSTGERQIWSAGAGQTNGDDVTYAGTLVGVNAPHGSARPQPRLAVYGLGQAGSAASGLTTSHAGADFSIPVTAQASFYGTLHPDFSNVEVDQSTISPTAFARVYSEVRPFFTQGANFYDNFSCSACPYIAQLYTPSIPTPRDGYAFEGKQGQVTVAAFDAVGVGRVDSAQSVNYTTPNRTTSITAQRVAADCSLPQSDGCQFGRAGVHDDTFTTGINYGDNKHVNAYFNYGTESGNTVTFGTQAQRYDGGVFVYTNTAGIVFAERKVGYSYDPADGFITHPDIAGYATYGVKYWQFSGGSVINSAGASFFLDRYHEASGALNQTDNSLTFDVLTKSRIDVQSTIGSSYVLESNCVDAHGSPLLITPLNEAATFGCRVFTPVTQSGIGLVYHSGTANSTNNFPNHGSSSTPTSLTYNTGRFGPGRLNSVSATSTMRAGTRATISLEADQTRQLLDAGGTNVQWLERGSYNVTLDAETSFSLGARRIIGTPPLVNALSPVSCTTVSFAPPPSIGGCTGAWNLSFALHKRYPHDEIYAAYGDASRLSTYPAFTVKFIHYLGAEKGT